MIERLEGLLDPNNTGIDVIPSKDFFGKADKIQWITGILGGADQPEKEDIVKQIIDDFLTGLLPYKEFSAIADGGTQYTEDDTPIFGVARLKCKAVGYKYTNDIVVEKTEDMKVTDLNATITVTWGADQSKELQLEIPGCAQAYLERCPSGDGFLNQDCKDRPSVDIWYSTCDGNILHIEQIDPCDD